MNRDHYMSMGVVVLLLGLTLQYVESFTLNEPATKALAKQMGQEETAWVPIAKTVSPPPWLRYCFMSVGAVLLAHGVAMKKPGK